jgi:putative transposase
MPRHERLDFKNAIHYVRVRGADGSQIFFDASSLRSFPYAARQYAPHVLRFEHLLATACTECGAVLHGYCLAPNSGILVLRTAGAALQAVMQRLCGRYARYLRTDSLVRGRGVFAARYDSKAVAPEYLPHAVRRAHRSPIVNGLCRRRVDYPFSSDRAYCGEAASLPVDTLAVTTALEHKGHFGKRGYREFMDQDETLYVANLLSHGSPLDSRVVGDKVFVQRARYLAAHPALPPTQEQLIDAVARILNGTPADIFSATQTGVLGRALVAWYGVRTGTATLAQMGRWFSVTGATLGQAIRHHRRVARNLFDLAVLPELEGSTRG